jgi:hypothetical protein
LNGVGFRQGLQPCTRRINVNVNVKSGAGFLLVGRGGVGLQDTP